MLELDNGPGRLTIEEALEQFNQVLIDRSAESGIPVGPISIAGAGGDDAAKMDAITEQYLGIIERTSSPPPTLPEESS